MDLEQQVEAAFAPGGILSRTTDHFMPRTGQTDMAMAVARAIEGAYPLVVEASTGVGKKQMMVDDHHIGGQGFAAGQIDMAGPKTRTG